MDKSKTGDERILRDQDARDVVTSVLDRNVMVLAGAGAGKTHALVERMVALVRCGKVQIDRIAAITFTRKAAGEMRGRFLRRLREEEKKVEGAEAARIQSALREIDQCFIGTIHAFCGRLLRERPIEAGLPPDFSEIEDRDEALLRRTAWDRFVQERIAEDDDRIYELEEHGIAPEDLYKFFGRRCGYRDLPLKRTETPRPDLAPAAAEIERFISEVLPHIPSRPERRDKLMDAVRRGRHFIDNHGISTERDRALLIKQFEGDLTPTLKRWEAERAFAKELKHERLPGLQERVVAPALKAWRECAYRIVASFVDDAVACYDGVRQQSGKVTFQDLLLRAEGVLRTNADVRQYFQHRFRCILVDEFQDTDPVQARILMYLAGQDTQEKDWLALEPIPGSLFLVGDDKQSIYRFRRADVEIFRQVRERIEATGGEVVHLNTSFRSLGNLCRWLSDAFPSIFEGEADPYQAHFKPLFQYRPPGIDPHCVRRITISKIDRNSRSEIIKVDARRIAGYIAAAMRGETALNAGAEDAILAAKATPGDFMILTRTATQISAYARALEAEGIPFDLVGGGRIGDAAEVKALLDLLETIYSPDNPVPYLSFLRGPLVGLADDELYTVRRAGGNIHYRAPIPDDLEPDLYRRISNARALLESAEDVLTSRPVASAIEQIMDQTGLLAYSAVHPDGQASFRAGNLLRVLSLIRQHAARGMHWGEIVEDLRALVEDSEYELAEMTLEAGRDDVVRLMNLHQAKGLQAKVVFLADPYDLTAYKWEPDAHVSRAGDQPYLAMTVSKPNGDYDADLVAQPAEWERDLEEERRFEAAEEVRLLYVAATRARNLLVVSKYEGRIDKGPWHPLYRFLEGVPELKEPKGKNVPVRSDDTVEWSVLKDLQVMRLNQAKCESCRVTTVSGASADEEMENRRREGRGRTYGTLVHQLFDDAIGGRLPDDEEAYVDRIFREADLDHKLVSDALRALDRLRASNIYQEAVEAREVYTEVPLGLQIRGEKEEIVHGVIDLVYRKGESWKIVDYKTDAAETLTDVAHLEKRYRPQVKAYKKYWEAITGERVESCDLWFVHGPAKESQLTLF